MSFYKRKHDDNDSSLRKKPRGEVNAPVDVTYGQRSAIPGLDNETRGDSDTESLDCDEDLDALAYLRAVRQEANGIPNLLVAPPPEDTTGRAIYETGVGDHRARYEDGAYYAATTSDQASSTGELNYDEEEYDKNVTYFDSILTRFKALQAQLAQVPPAETLEKLDKDHPTYLGPLTTALARCWRWKMKTVEPMPAQVASMDKGTVLKLLGLLSAGNLLQRGKKIELVTSRWVWGLLAKIPDRGQLNSEEIGVVRELGKKAILVGMGLKDDQETNECMDELDPTYIENDYKDEDVAVMNKDEIDLEDMDTLDSDPGNRDLDSTTAKDLDTTSLAMDAAEEHCSASLADAAPTPVEDLATAKARIINVIDSLPQEEKPVLETEEVEDPNWNTKATVDMILTVAGEIYGQRDLLEFRGIWDQIL